MLPTLAFALAAVAVWLASHQYLGIRHDAIFYSFLALARLHPESLSGDLFVRFGSQDAFTVFSPLYAFVMARLGFEGGALWLATLGQLCFWSAALALLSQLLPGPRRWLALAILAAWPGAYGAQDVFSYAEYFVSPRAFAEAAVMAALAAHFAGRLQISNNWSPAMVRDPSTYWLGLEYFCNERDDLWSMPDGAFLEFAARELEQIDLIDRADVLDGTVVRVPKAYPAYFGEYRNVGQVRDWLDAFTNVFPVGRNGMHRYNNQDHSMLAAKAAVDAISSRQRDKRALWAINTEEDYHEESASQKRFGT